MAEMNNDPLPPLWTQYLLLTALAVLVGWLASELVALWR
jgi:hypothetical protein